MTAEQQVQYPPPARPVPRVTVDVLGAPIDVLDWGDAVSRLVTWGEARESRYVCICNAHSVVTGQQDPQIGRAHV